MLFQYIDAYQAGEVYFQKQSFYTTCIFGLFILCDHIKGIFTIHCTCQDKS